ncbi:sigma 54-interacting transcriptional regulator [Desulfovibrio sp. OttesenSCG-928-G15]|nr:sigma 54-interacting transcriptional regulator [Desulfovibrio sp. OttesenSCG-928-G15]
MRFAIPPAQIKRKLAKKESKEWPLALRFLLLALPTCVIVALVSIGLGYQSASKAFYDTLESVPLMEAKSMAKNMERTLNELQNSLLRIAKASPAQFRYNRKALETFFHENTNLVQEFGLLDSDGNGYLLLRHGATEFSELDVAQASTGTYSPFQQINTSQLQHNTAILFPPVFFNPQTVSVPDSANHSPVMRLASLLPDRSGTVVLGINLMELRSRMATFVRTDSPLRLPIQQGALQFSFFFDTRGWILFETSSSPGKSFIPDLSREGYGGDLGRPGYDAAFRPWASHMNYWNMVTKIASGESGSSTANADKYLPAHIGSKGFISYAPVTFEGIPGQAPAVVGGIAFFETSPLPLDIFMRLANYSVGIFVACLVVCLLMAYYVHRRAGAPIVAMAKDIETMHASGKLDFIDGPTVFQEHHALVYAFNHILGQAMQTRKDLALLSKEMHAVRERQPVALKPEKVIPVAMEYDLIGSSMSIQDIREQIRKASRANTDVLIWGETGTGKELVAAAIHKASPRHKQPYISINCGALDENLLLDALFGHIKGAFSEAKNDRKGAFLAANGGTLHLDEIANASAKVQQSLLRALSIRKIRPLGTDEEVPFTTKVVAATNVDLRECVRVGSFREDLYYRLAIISIETPPLRHRKGDLPELASFFIHEAAAALGKAEPQLSRGALELMYSYDWPGNVREFKNCITRAMAFVEGDLILPQHITLEQDTFAGNANRLFMLQGEAPLYPPSAALPQSALPVTPILPVPPVSQTPPPPHAAPAPQQDLPVTPKPQAPAMPVQTNNSGLAADQETSSAAPQTQSTAPQTLPLAKTPEPGAAQTQGLNERQLRALSFIRRQGKITRAEYESVVGAEVSSRTAQNDLRELVERGILIRKGAGPGTSYLFNSNG